MNTPQHELEFDVLVDFSQVIEFSQDEGLVIESSFLSFGENEPHKVIISFEKLVNNSIELGKISEDYKHVYCMAHELERNAEKLRDVAQRIEDTRLVGDMFDVDMDNLPEVL